MFIVLSLRSGFPYKYSTIKVKHKKVDLRVQVDEQRCEKWPAMAVILKIISSTNRQCVRKDVLQVNDDNIV